MFIREVAGAVRTATCSTLRLKFLLKRLNKSEELRKKLQIAFDGFAGNLLFKALHVLKINDIVVAGPPRHTLHVLQPLDVFVFDAFQKAFFKRL